MPTTVAVSREKRNLPVRRQQTSIPRRQETAPIDHRTPPKSPREVRSPRRRQHLDSDRVILGQSSRGPDRKSTRLNSCHVRISYAVFCLKKKNDTIAGQHHRHKQSIIAEEQHTGEKA